MATTHVATLGTHWVPTHINTRKHRHTQTAPRRTRARYDENYQLISWAFFMCVVCSAEHYKSGSRSRRDRVRAARPPKAVATYLSVRSGSWRYDLRRESCWAARGGANGARPRAHPLWGRGPGRRIWWARGRAPFGTSWAACARPSIIPGANHIYRSWSARLCRDVRP